MSGVPLVSVWMRGAYRRSFLSVRNLRRIVVKIRLTSSISERRRAVSDAGNQPMSSHSVSKVSVSAKDPCETAKKCALSPGVSRVQPSAMLAGTETAARVICDRIP